MNVQSPPRDSGRIPRARLWFGTCAGAAAWAIHGFTCFQIATLACQDGRGAWGPLSPGGVRILLGCITIVLLAIAIAGGMISYGNWRKLADHTRISEAQATGRENFMALIGVFVSVAFAIGIIWAGIPFIFMDVCINAR